MPRQYLPKAVDNATDLATFHVSEFEDGTWCFVRNLAALPIGSQLWYLDKRSAIPDDGGLSVVAPLDGSPIAGAPDARWLACPCGSIVQPPQ